MKILIEKPPIYEEAHKHFDIDDTQTVYAWGDILYNPANVDIDEAVMAHESTHSRQQADSGGPEKWWKLYFDWVGFRIHQEIEAYSNQYRIYCFHEHDRNLRAKYLWKLGNILAGPLYKGDLTAVEARIAIRDWPLIR